jgi:equilibrative nucleoside transporter 1/2/3
MPRTLSRPQPLELQDLSNMDRIKSLFRAGPEYEPLSDDAVRDDESTQEGSDDGAPEAPFSWVEYVIFLLLGIAMLWAW